MLFEIQTGHTPESLTDRLRSLAGVVLLRSGRFHPEHGRYSFVAARPFLRFRSFGPHCEVRAGGRTQVHYGDPWRFLEALLARYELLDAIDLPFPLGGCFGYWGYELNRFLEPRLPRRPAGDLDLPDCDLGFYDSLVVFDHQLSRTWIVSTGLQEDGSRNPERARKQREFWSHHLDTEAADPSPPPPPVARSPLALPPSSLERPAFLAAVRRAQEYIRAGHIYQVNLAQRFTAPAPVPPWEFFLQLATLAPAPFAAWLDAGDFQIASSSMELFLRLSGARILTRPIKGTRRRGADPTRDAQLGYELQTSPKERAELVMITDLLRNDLGRVCAYGSVQVPELLRLERYAQVQHLVATVEGHLRPGVSHFQALAACFPGGSVTGAPKVRAMEILDELEPVRRGPYTGALGYLGFNGESQLSILIRLALWRHGQVHYHTGAGIVADSDPEAEYDETLAKAAAYLQLVSRAVPTPLPQGPAAPATDDAST